jgi:hypothetical protein
MEKPKFNKKTFIKLATMNFGEPEPQEKKFQRVSLRSKRRQSNFNLISYQMSNKLKELIEKNEEYAEEEEEEEEDIKNISFELLNVNDMTDLLDNFSDKSDEKIELEFQSTTNEEGIELIEDYLKESTKQILENRKGFDKDAKKLSEEFYNDFIKNLDKNKLNTENDIDNLKKNLDISLNRGNSKEEYNSFIDNFNNIIDNKRKSYMESKGSNMISESYTSGDNTPELKYFLGQSDSQKNGKIFSLNNKYKNSSKFIVDEADEEKLDKIIEIRKKKSGK